MWDSNTTLELSGLDMWIVEQHKWVEQYRLNIEQHRATQHWEMGLALIPC